MKVYEAFKPSGSNSAERSAGLFTGDPESIRRWVALNSDTWRTEQIRVQTRKVRHMDEETLLAWEAARGKARAAGAALSKIEHSM